MDQDPGLVTRLGNKYKYNNVLDQQHKYNYKCIYKYNPVLDPKFNLDVSNMNASAWWRSLLENKVKLLLLKFAEIVLNYVSDL